MSTDFYTDPPIPYDDFIKSKDFIFESCPRPILYRYYSTLILKHKDLEGSLFVARNPETGAAFFERFGSQNPMILQKVIDVFKVKIFDYCGLEWPNESGG